MRESARKIAAVVTCGAVLASLAYGAFAWSRVVAFGRRPVHERFDAAADAAAAVPDGLRDPAVTVLKPLRGTEPQLAELIASFCDQDYDDGGRGGRFEVIFGTHDPDDPALAVAREVAARFSGRARVVAGDDRTPRYANPKIDTLAAMIPHARGDVLVIADSDMRVDRAYLRAVIAPFADPQTGAVTCLYRGVAAGADLASALGAQANHEHFAPSVLVAQALMPQRLCFGATMAVRRDVFEAFGGLDALGSHLADDARLGALVGVLGKRVFLSRYVVENVVAERGLRGLWQHELRWARTHRVLAPGGYLGLCLTYPIALALMHLPFARRRKRALTLLALAVTSRVALATAARRAFGVRTSFRPWLVPLRDAFGFAVWTAAFFAGDVRWRKDAFGVTRDGRLVARTP